ncbi:MAG: T9SS type A sorting domain-containing protein [Candidatus Cloacimonetes bacterium]|nr:T9SS type A sorting domain-containing protein [Candidatus Cloacimonadota bacterium]
MKKIIFAFLLFLVCGTSYTQIKNVGITFEFENGEVIVENLQEYYAFDIMAYATEDGTFFGSGMIYLNYNTTSFGQNVSSEDNIIVEKGELIQGELAPGIPLYEFVNITDNSSSCIAITTGYLFPMLPEEANILPSTPTQYLHIKLKIIDISGYSGLSFKENLMQDQQYQSDDTTIYEPVIANDIDNTDLPVIQPESKPTIFGILETIPNPFGALSPHTSLTIISPQSGKLSLNVFNIKGQLVNTLYNDVVQKNQDIQLSWNGKDSQSNDLSSGIYLYQLLIENKLFEIKKVVIIR